MKLMQEYIQSKDAKDKVKMLVLSINTVCIIFSNYIHALIKL